MLYLFICFRWLNPTSAAISPSKLSLDARSGMIESTSGFLSLVEFRNKYNVTLTSFQPGSTNFDVRELLQEFPNVEEIFAINEFGQMLKFSASNLSA